MKAVAQASSLYLEKTGKMPVLPDCKAVRFDSHIVSQGKRTEYPTRERNQ